MKYRQDTKHVYFQGNSFVIENDTPIFQSSMKKESIRNKINSDLFDIFVKSKIDVINN